MYCEDHDQGYMRPPGIYQEEICCTREPPISLQREKKEQSHAVWAGKVPGGPANSTLTTYQAGKEAQIES